MDYDVIIIGGGPAGLSAALVLGRCRRKVLVCDEGHPRNECSSHVHSFFAQDDLSPLELLTQAREQLRPYPTVKLLQARASDAGLVPSGFRVTLDDGSTYTSRKLLLATGLVDEFPKVEGFKELYGSSIFQCPYCDGWEVRDKKIGVYAQGKRAFDMTRALTVWSKDLFLFTDGPSGLSTRQEQVLGQKGIQIREDRVSRFQGEEGRLKAVVLSGGEAIPRDALFFDLPSFQKSELPTRLGCHFNSNGGVQTKKYEATDVPGLFAAGNITKDVQLVIVAAAEGARAAFGINRSLTREDFGHP